MRWVVPTLGVSMYAVLLSVSTFESVKNCFVILASSLVWTENCLINTGTGNYSKTGSVVLCWNPHPLHTKENDLIDLSTPN